MFQTVVAVLFAVGGVSAQYQHLGVPQEVVSPSFYPYRTALNTVSPSGSYYPVFNGYTNYNSGYNLYNPYYLGYNYASPFYFNNRLAVPSVYPNYFQAPSVQKAAPAVEQVSPAVEVGVDEDEDDSPAIVTVQHTVDALPEPPRTIDAFRGVPEPVIPAGIVQATQPVFSQEVFVNAKVSPGFRYVGNSKVSDYLTRLQENSAGILVV